MNRDNDIGIGTKIHVHVVRDSDTLIITYCFFYSYQVDKTGKGYEIVVSFRLVPNNCELVLTKDWSPLYRLEPITLGGCIFLSV